jgi:hypothetical protein
VHPLGGEDVMAHQLGQRAQHGRTGADVIGQGRYVEVDAFAGVGLALPVQRLMLAVLGVEDHRQQARPDMAARDDVERRRRLGDLLAGPAGELLAHGLDHLPLPRHALQRLGDRLAEFGQLAAAARARRRAGDYHALARQMRRKRRPHRPVAGGRVHRRAASRRRRDLVLGREGRNFLELQLQLVEQFAAALGGLPVLFAPQLGDLQLVIGDQRLGARGPRLGLLTCLSLGGQGCRQHRDRLGCRHERDCRTPQAAPRPSSTAESNRRRPQPAACGRHIRTGLRQSIPSSEGLQEYPLL